MLELAYFHKDEVNKLYAYAMLDKKYKYLCCQNYFTIDQEFHKDTWGGVDYVSVHEKTKEVIGLLRYTIDRTNNIVHGISIANFKDKYRREFFNDLTTFFEGIYNDKNFVKIEMSVIKGNPAEKHYDKMIKLYDGWIEGIKKNSVKIVSGEYCDSKMYGIYTKHSPFRKEK